MPVAFQNVFSLSKIGFCVLVALLHCVVSVSGQQFGGNPPSIKWQQINTDTARIIFPAGLEESGKRIATVIHELQKNHANTIGNRLAKINVVLQNQGILSNGYVGLGPYRSEFYLVAPQNSFNLGAINWADNLSLHEYRHVQQYNNFNVGLSKFFGIVFGQEGRAVANAAAIPDWFFEGDAVFNETVLSNQGRGRLPEFFNGYQSLYKQGRKFSYMKLRNGSFNDYVPNHYNLGYLLVGYGFEKYGADFWKQVTQEAARFKPLVYPLQGAVKKYSGKSYTQFVNDAFTHYESKWMQSKGVSLQYLTMTNRYKTDYKYPYLAEDGKVITIKSGYQTVPTFVTIDTNGNQQKLAIREIAYDDYFSYKNGLIVYAAYAPDARWGYKEYSNIKLLNVSTNKLSKITGKERYFSPDISHDGKKIAVVDMRTNQTSNIAVLGIDGQKIFRSISARGIVYTYPKFSADDAFIYAAIRNAEGLMSFKKIDIATGKELIILPFANRIIGFPTVQGDTIFFSSSYKGSDEIWAYLESKNETYRVAVHPTGLYQAVFNKQGNHLITSNFTADGYRLATIPASALLWQKVDEKDDALPDLYIHKALNQQNNNTLQSIETKSYPVSGYKKATGLINFHSLRPYYDQPETSLILYGQNVLNTFQTELGYTYNNNEGSHRANLNIIYGGLFVQPVAGISQTWGRTVNLNQDTALRYNELNANIGLRLPLNLSGGRQFRSLVLSSSLNTQQVKATGLGKAFIRDQSFNFLQHRLTYSGQIQKAIRNIYPHWAQTLVLQHRHVINNYTANQFLANGSLYLPGMHPTHNIVFSAAYQQRDTMNQYAFSNSFPFSRGYTSINFPRMWRFGINYHFPLLYPDFGVANIVYCKRVRANTFYDYTQTKSLRTGTKSFFSTAGAEIYFDTKWWNQQDVIFGLRYSRLLDKEFRGPTRPNQWELILPVNLFN